MQAIADRVGVSLNSVSRACRAGTARTRADSGGRHQRRCRRRGAGVAGAAGRVAGRRAAGRHRAGPRAGRRRRAAHDRVRPRRVEPQAVRPACRRRL
ncbi:MAG: hypothetical protein KY460_17335 [Actinobacteria bacterium]|nr:hypothetical protein [Actinomycetota bacterium]